MNTFKTSITKRTLIFFSATLVILLTIGVMPAAAAETGSGSQIICGGSESTQRLFRFMIGAFMSIGFFMGVLLYIVGKFETAGEPIFYDDWLGGYGKQASQTLQKAMFLPILVYFFDFVDTALFGIEIGCIVPNIG